jgi:hypothetical protein
MEGGVSEDKIEKEEVLRRLDSLPDDDRATQRTNPFAVSVDSGQLVTADEIAIGIKGEHANGFLCPACKAELRHHVNPRGTPYFAHVGARGKCESGFETPAHLCIKRGLESIGLISEHLDANLGFKYDLYDPATKQAVEVVCSGLDRYFNKIEKTTSAGVDVNWIIDSAAKGLTTADGAEQLCRSSLLSGAIVVGGFFKPKAYALLKKIPDGRLFMFYRGLFWGSVGLDKWQLLDESHAFNRAASCDGGVKHLMVMMHIANANTVVENRRRGINRKTWFDRRFRYRGQKQKPSGWNLTWGTDRGYIEEIISRLVESVSVVKSRHSVDNPGHSETSYLSPRHASAEKIVRMLTEKHAASFDEILKLRAVVDATRKSSPRIDAPLPPASQRPLYVDGRPIINIHPRRIVSSRWDWRQTPEMRERKLLNAINKELQEASQAKVPAEVQVRKLSTQEQADQLAAIQRNFKAQCEARRKQESTDGRAQG